MTQEAFNAVVIGGTGGIGRELVARLAATGSKVLFTYKDSREAADVVVTKSPSVIAMAADVTVEESVADVLDAAERHLGDYTAVISTVGLSLGGSVHDLSYDGFRSTTDLNLYGPLLVAKTFAPALKARGGGSLVNIASVAGVRPEPRGHDYVAAKAGLIGLTASLAKELAPLVTVNCVAPGWIDSGTRPRYSASSEFGRIPLERWGTPAEVVDVLMLLAKPGGYLTGQTIVVDGGFTL